MRALVDVTMIARGLNALAAQSQAPGMWAPQQGSLSDLRSLIAMWSEHYKVDPFRLSCAVPGGPLDRRLAHYGIGSYFQDLPGAGLFTSTMARLVLNRRPGVVRVAAPQGTYNKLLYCKNDPVSNTVLQTASRHSKPVARISVVGGWLYALEMRQELAAGELFGQAQALLAGLEGQRISRAWSGILLPAVAYAGVRQVDWLKGARYNNDLSLAGAFQSMEIRFDLPADLPVVDGPKVNPGEPPVVVFDGPTLLVHIDRRQRIKWVCHYDRSDWAAYEL